MPTFQLAAVLDLPELPAYLEQAERCLADTAPIDSEQLGQSVANLLAAGSKRLRPVLFFAVAASQGKRIDRKCVAVAAAIELLHLGSLVHDDVIDAAASRWGKPTIYSQSGSSQAIIVGDYLFAKAAGLAATVSPAVAGTLAEALAALCEGQMLELADQFNTKRSEAAMMCSIEGKTAALFSTACRLAGLCAGLEEAKCEALAQYGESFGMAFQLLDDLLDILSTLELSGKAIGGDIVQGVYTAPVLYALRSSAAQELRELLQAKPAVYDPAIATILIRTGAVRETLKTIDTYIQAAATALNTFDDRASIATLQALPAKYGDWALTNLVAPRYQSIVKA